MGVWGTGLYSGDFATDLRSVVKAVARLPFDGDKLATIVCETEPEAANNPDNEDHTIFWLVLADQFAKRGIACRMVREKARAIIEDGTDLSMLEKLGMEPAGLKKRGRLLRELHAQLSTAPVESKSRTTLKKPQPLLLNVGDVFIYPTCRGKCINPYFPSKDKNYVITDHHRAPWIQDGWMAMAIVDNGRAFGYLSWYRPLVMHVPLTEKPTLDSLRGERIWELTQGGTCSPMHFKRMELERIGSFSIGAAQLKQAFPEMRPSISQAVNDISIANSLSSRTSPDHGARQMSFITDIEKILVL